jgi:predicted AAA+ superfamily ATPase
MTVSIASTVKINLRLSQRILRETAYDGFFALVVDGVQRTGKTSYVSKGLTYANGE